MPATAAATKGTINSVALIEFTIFLASNIPADKMTGTEIKKENLIDCSLLSPEISPPVIVMPERDAPGIKAKT